MLTLPNFLAALAMLLPSGIGGLCDSVSIESPAAFQADGCSVPRDLLFSATHLPSPAESFFECLVETALDEEDSNRVEDHGIVPLTYLDFEACWSDNLVAFFLPSCPHMQSLVILPILRC